MASDAPEAEPYIVQPVLNELFTSRDLLDFDDAPTIVSPQPVQHGAAASLLSSVSQFAAGLNQRNVTSPPSGSGTPPATSPTRASQMSPPAGGAPATAAAAAAAAGPSGPMSPADLEVRSVEGYANNLYVGGSDGSVEWWTYDGSAGTSESRGWKLQVKHKVFPARPVRKIILLPKVGKCFVLSDGTLHPFLLPNLEPVPTSQIQPVRGVVSVALNDDELDLGADAESVTDMTMVVVKRKGLVIYRLGARMTSVKEIPLPGAATSHALFSTYFCAALPAEFGLTYCVIDLSDASMTEVLPVSQVGDADGWVPNPNTVVIPGENQFLVTSYTGGNTMGVFLNGQGDPERGTMEWNAHPLSIAVESGFIFALLRNNTVTIHSLNDLESPVQTINLDPALNTFQLSYSPYGISIRDIIRDGWMATAPFKLLSGKLSPVRPAVELPSAEETDSPPDTDARSESPNEEPLPGSGLTPPSSPKFKKQPVKTPSGSSSLLATSSAGPREMPTSSAIAETLLVGRHGVQGFTPTPTFMRLQQLCDAHKMDEAIALVDEERRKGRRGEIEGDKATHTATLRLLHLYLASNLLLETVFERAGDYFSKGKIDARLIVRLFPEYRGKVIGTEEEVSVFDGLRPVLEKMGTVSQIITDFLDRNASNHAPDEKRDLGLALYDSAKHMLLEFLKKTRTSRRRGNGSRGSDSRKVDTVIDNTLAKLLADEGQTTELLSLLDSTNDVVLSELEPFLAKKKYILSTVMRQQGRTDRVLELLKDIADDPQGDPLCPDPVGELVKQLDNVKDPEQLRHYALWLVKRSPEQGLNILVSKVSKMNVDDAQLVKDLEWLDNSVAHRYLEHVVINKRSSNRDLNEALLSWLFDQATEMAKDDGIKYHLEELDAEYRLLSEPQCYPLFFAEIAPSTPFKTMRLKLMLFLQGNQYYDLNQASKRLEELQVLVMERVIVLGRLGQDRSALALLVRELPDPMSAQNYCTQGGEVVPPKVARELVTHAPELVSWAAMGEGRKRRGTVDTDTQHKLVRELLGAYMRDGGSGSSSTARTAELLSAQGVHLDTMEVLKLVPNDWPLDVITTFYKRSLRRQMHERSKWQVLKAISAGQNMAMAEKYLDAMARIPPTVVDTAPPGGSEDEKGLEEKEPESLDEKDREHTEEPTEMEEAGYSVPSKEVPTTLVETARSGLL